MADPIEAHYTPDGDGWTVAVKGRGRTLTGRAPGLVAARDKADELAEQLASAESGHKTVVHMLNGDAVDFTTAYLTARLARTEEPPAVATPAAEPTPADEATENRPTEAPDSASAAAEPTAEAKPTDEAARPTAKTESTDRAESVGGATSREMPAPAASAEGEPPAAAKPTPAPRTEAQTAHPAAPPAEETAPATRESRVQT